MKITKQRKIAAAALGAVVAGVSTTEVANADSVKAHVYYVDQNGAPFEVPTVLTGAENSNYKTEAKTFAGYHLTAMPKNANGKLTKATGDIVYRYAPDSATIKTIHQDLNNQDVSPSVSQSGQVNQYDQTVKATPNGYHQAVDPWNANGVYRTKNDDVKYLYDKNNEKTVVKYVDEKGNLLAPEKSVTGKFGASYVADGVKVRGYHLTKTPDNAQGTFSDKNSDIIFVYAPDTEKAKVSYFDIWGNKIANDAIISGQFGDEYVAKPKTIAGYQLVNASDNATGKFDVVNSDIHFVYKRIDGQPEKNDLATIKHNILDPIKDTEKVDSSNASLPKLSSNASSTGSSVSSNVSSASDSNDDRYGFDNDNDSKDNYNDSDDNYNDSDDNYNDSDDNYNDSDDDYNDSDDNYNDSDDNYNDSDENDADDSNADDSDDNHNDPDESDADDSNAGDSDENYDEDINNADDSNDDTDSENSDQAMMLNITGANDAQSIQPVNMQKITSSVASSAATSTASSNATANTSNTAKAQTVNGADTEIKTNSASQLTTTVWIDKDGHQLKPQETGAHPDQDNVSDIPGYRVDSVAIDSKGNVVNRYVKTVQTVEAKPAVVHDPNAMSIQILNFSSVSSSVSAEPAASSSASSNASSSAQKPAAKAKKKTKTARKHANENAKPARSANENVKTIAKQANAKTTAKQATVTQTSVPNKTQTVMTTPAGVGAAASNAKLPQTGSKEELLTALGLTMLSSLGISILAKKRKED